jgi:hypothetical protein
MLWEAARALRRIEHQARADKRARARDEAFRASVPRGSEPAIACEVGCADDQPTPPSF